MVSTLYWEEVFSISYLVFFFQGLEKEQTERTPQLDELKQTGQTLLDQMGKGEILWGFFLLEFLEGRA